MRISCTVVKVSVAPKHPPNIPAKNSMMMKIRLSGIAMMHMALRPSAIVTSTLGLKLYRRKENGDALLIVLWRDLKGLGLDSRKHFFLL